MSPRFFLVNDLIDFDRNRIKLNHYAYFHKRHPFYSFLKPFMRPDDSTGDMPPSPDVPIITPGEKNMATFIFNKKIDVYQWGNPADK